MSYALTHKRTFILKPDAGAQGKGIWLTNDLKMIGPNERLICQTYIHRVGEKQILRNNLQAQIT